MPMGHGSQANLCALFPCITFRGLCFRNSCMGDLLYLHWWRIYSREIPSVHWKPRAIDRFVMCQLFHSKSTLLPLLLNIDMMSLFRREP